MNVNLAAAAERGVEVRSTPGRNVVAAAEHTIALLLAALRAIPANHASRPGRRVARILRAFDATVLVHDPYAEPTTLDGVVPLPLDELLSRSEIVSLHARLTPETRDLIGAAELARLPRGATLVNTARGGLVDYAAVADALAQWLAGA